MEEMKNRQDLKNETRERIIIKQNDKSDIDKTILKTAGHPGNSRPHPPLKSI